MVMHPVVTLRRMSVPTDLETYLRRCLHDAGLTQHQAGRQLGRHQTWFTHYLFGKPEETVRNLYVKSPEKFEQTMSLLRADQRTVLELAGITTPPSPNAETVETDRAVPLYGPTAGPDLAQRDIVDYIGVPTMITGGTDDLIAIMIRGDAMKPYLSDGEIAYIRRGETPSPGDAVGLYMPDVGTVVMTFLRDLSGGEILLQVENPAPGQSPVVTAPKGSTIHGVVTKRLVDA